MLLSGDAGVGKSRLASELGELAARDFGAEVLTGQCVPYGDANVFVPVAEALRAGVGDVDDADTDDRHPDRASPSRRARVLEPRPSPPRPSAWSRACST